MLTFILCLIAIFAIFGVACAVELILTVVGVGIVGLIIASIPVIIIISLVLGIIERIRCKLGFHDIDKKKIIVVDGVQHALCPYCDKRLIYDGYNHKWKEDPNGGLYNEGNPGSEES